MFNKINFKKGIKKSAMFKVFIFFVCLSLWSWTPFRQQVFNNSIVLFPSAVGMFGEAFASNDGTFASKSGWSNTAHVRILADVNGDGRADYVGFANEKVLVQLGKADGRFGATIIANDGFFCSTSGWLNSSHVRTVADVNGDGKVDLVGFGNEKVFVQLGQADGRFGSYIVAHGAFFLAGTGWNTTSHARLLGDVNGDGKADIVGLGNEKGFIALGQANGTFGPEREMGNAAFYSTKVGWTNKDHIRVLADVNGDKRADLVGIGNDKVFVSLGQADGNFAPQIEAHGNYFTNANGWNNTVHTRTLADVNADGRADIIGFGNEIVLIALGQANGTFGGPITSNNKFFLPPSGWTAALHFRGVADVNGDKKADLVGTGNDMTFTALSGNVTQAAPVATQEGGFRVMLNGIECTSCSDGITNDCELYIEVFVDGKKVARWGKRSMNLENVPKNWVQDMVGAFTPQTLGYSKKQFWLMPGSVWAQNSVEFKLWEEDEGGQSDNPTRDNDDFIGSHIINSATANGNNLSATMINSGSYRLVFTKITRDGIDPTLEGQCARVPVRVPILSQGQVGACVAFSTVAALTSIYLNKTSPGTSREDLFDPLYFYGLRADPTKDEGWHISLALDVLKSKGLPFKNDPNKIIKITGYRRITDRNEMRKALKQGKPLLAAYAVYADFGAYAGEQGVYGGRVTANNKEVGWHAVMVVGYENPAIKANSFPVWVLQNSWGPDFGDNGLCKFAQSACGFDDEMYLIEDVVVVAK